MEIIAISDVCEQLVLPVYDGRAVLENFQNGIKLDNGTFLQIRAYYRFKNCENVRILKISLYFRNSEKLNVSISVKYPV